MRAGESSLKSGAYADALRSSSIPLWAELCDGATSTSSATSTDSPQTTSVPVTEISTIFSPLEMLYH